jgi:hypothetical protein
MKPDDRKRPEEARLFPFWLNKTERRLETGRGSIDGLKYYTQLISFKLISQTRKIFVKIYRPNLFRLVFIKRRFLREPNCDLFVRQFALRFCMFAFTTLIAAPRDVSNFFTLRKHNFPFIDLKSKNHAVPNLNVMPQ